MTDRKPPKLFPTMVEIALVHLLMTLRDTQDYLDKGEDLDAIGTLVRLDELVADLNAALRLYRRNRGRLPSSERGPPGSRARMLVWTDIFCRTARKASKRKSSEWHSVPTRSSSS